MSSCSFWAQVISCIVLRGAFIRVTQEALVPNKVVSFLASNFLLKSDTYPKHLLILLSKRIKRVAATGINFFIESEFSGRVQVTKDLLLFDSGCTESRCEVLHKTHSPDH